MTAPSVVRHMSSVEEYRDRLATLQGSWDTLSLLSHLSGDGTEMGSTRKAFEALAHDLVDNLAAETHKKTLLRLKSTAQIAIDILIRNLFERTADIGFLSTDEQLRRFVAKHAGGANEGERAHDAEKLRQRLREYVAKYSVYDDVILLATDGTVLLRLDEREAIAHCSDTFVSEAQSTQRGYVESFGRSTLFPNRAHALLYSYRISNGGRTIGTLCLSFKFEDEVGAIFGELRDPDDWNVFAFLDAKGVVLASSDPWQVPAGATLPLALQEGGAVVRFAGREYLAITRRTHGYQGYMGPGWFAHAMIPLEHAFEHGGRRTEISARMLADLRESAAIFSDALRRIPRQAQQIQRELNRTVWNGNVRLGQRAGSNDTFAKVLLWEIGNAGRRTQETFERSMGDLQETVISSILDDVQQLASLAVDVLDRNLYERANDCRWWALNAGLASHLATESPDREQVTAMLQHLNSLYTVYRDIVLFDGERRVSAVANPDHARHVGTPIKESWASATLGLRSSQEFAVSRFESSAFYADAPTLVFGAALRHGNHKAVGGIGIVFDAQPQMTAMLRDALPRDESGDCIAGSIGLFVDDALKVLATTSNHTIGATIDLPRELLSDKESGQLIELDGTYYAVGTRRSSGYREYAGLGATAVLLVPLGTVGNAATQPHGAAKQTLQREVTRNEQLVDVATFRSADQWLGLLRDQVVEAVDGSSLRAVPGAPPWYAGLLMFRGTPIPVLDLAHFVEGSASNRRRDVVVARTAESAGHVGLLIDDLDHIPEIPVSRILPITNFAQRGGPSVIDRAVRPNQPDDPVLFIVNLEQVMLHVNACAALVTKP